MSDTEKVKRLPVPHPDLHHAGANVARGAQECAPLLKSATPSMPAAASHMDAQHIVCAVYLALELALAFFLLVQLASKLIPPGHFRFVAVLFVQTLFRWPLLLLYLFGPPKDNISLSLFNLR